MESDATQENAASLQEDSGDATISMSGSTPKSAGDSPEDALGKYQETIASQQKQINTLLDQVTSLNAQIVSYVRSTGTQVDDAERASSDNPMHERGELPEDYVYLKDLGKEIGKR